MKTKFTEKEQEQFDTLFSSDFLRGQQDCIKGVEHRSQSDAYNRGYATQYATEQVDTARSESWAC